MNESVLQNALRLPWQLKEELVAALKATIFEEMAALSAEKQDSHSDVIRLAMLPQIR
ncbi:MAG: hypothetical protein IKF78_10680 [Atopobiaceae bacterium]|nr:hypothetical protein [Atopobiaceae bacterium]